MTGGEGEARVTRVGARATVEWDRPPLNVFDIPLLDRLASALRSQEVRSASVVVLRGARSRWSAGFAVEDHLADRVEEMFRAFRGLLGALEGIPAPTVAQVEGTCLGGGLEILGACDLAVAGSSATFGQPEIRLGVFPPIAAVELPRALGPKKAAELLLLGENCSSDRAEAIGLVSRTVPDELIAEEVDRIAGRLAGFRPEALRLLKRAMVLARAAPIEKARDRAERVYLDELMALPSSEEGLRAFLEKRSPVWPVAGG